MKKHVGLGAKSATLGVAALLALTAAPAYATEGAFVNGIGARNKAMAGAGVADQNDASAIAVNPAGLVNSGTQLNVSASFFVPKPGFTNINLGGAAFSDRSDANFFLMPHIFYNKRLDANTAAAFGVYPLFGMGTDYDIPQDFGIELSTGVISAALAKRIGNVSIGFAPGIAVTVFKAKGQLLPPPAPAYTDEVDVALGFGVRGGITWDVTQGFRVAVAGSSPYFMDNLGKYRALLGGNGNLRIPATLQAGVSFDLFQGFTVSADYKLIANKTSATISGDPTTGQGFGWENQDVFKIGIEWDVNPTLTLRAGYATNTDAIPTQNVQYNVLAPATSNQHFTAGAKMQVSQNIDLEIAGMYSPNNAISGPNGLGGTGSLDMDQYEVTVGIIWRRDEPEPYK